MTRIDSSATWRDVARRALRNAVQVALPVVALAATGVIDSAGVLSVGATAALAGGLSVLKSMAGFTVDTDGPTWAQILERVAAAAAGAVAGLLPLDLQGALSADWRSIGVAAVGAAALSLLTWFVSGTGGEGEHEE